MGVRINHGRVSHTVKERDICLVCLKSSRIFVESILKGLLFDVLGISPEDGKKNPYIARIIEINKKLK